MKIDIDSITQGEDPYEKFCDSIRDAETKRKYKSYLKQFLAEIPDNIFEMTSKEIPTTNQSKAKLFTVLAKKDQDMAQNIISQYIKLHKKRVEKGKLNPNTLPNLIKPIHALLDSNGVSIHWKSQGKLSGQRRHDGTYYRTGKAL